jgi:hypothetical protein
MKPALALIPRIVEKRSPPLPLGAFVLARRGDAARSTQSTLWQRICTRPNPSTDTHE